MLDHRFHGARDIHGVGGRKLVDLHVDGRTAVIQRRSDRRRRGADDIGDLVKANDGGLVPSYRERSEGRIGSSERQSRLILDICTPASRLGKAGTLRSLALSDRIGHVRKRHANLTHAEGIGTYLDALDVTAMDDYLGHA